MKKYLYFIFAFILFANNTHAQVSGYLGKRAWVNLSVPIGLQLPDLSDLYEEVPAARIYLRPGLSASYLVSENVDLGISYQRSSVKGYNIRISDQRDFNSAYYYGNMAIKSNMFSFFLEFHNKGSFGSLPPLGKFYRFEILLARGKPVFSEASTPFSYSPLFSLSDFPGAEDFSYSLPELLYTLGTRTIFFEGLVFEYGAQLGIPLSGAGWYSMINYANGERNLYTDYANDPEDAQEQFANLMRGYVVRSMIMNFHLSIGYLAF